MNSRSSQAIILGQAKDYYARFGVSPEKGSHLHMNLIKDYCSLKDISQIKILSDYVYVSDEEKFYFEKIFLSVINHAEVSKNSLSECFGITDIYKRSIYHFAASVGNLDVAKKEHCQKSDSFGFQPLHYACVTGQKNIVEHYLDKMLHVSQSHVTLLYNDMTDGKQTKKLTCSGIELAVIAGHVDIVECMIDAIVKRYPYKPANSFEQGNLLHLAVLSGQVNMAAFLCRSRFFPEWIDQIALGKTPLALAKAINNEDLVKVMENQISLSKMKTTESSDQYISTPHVNHHEDARNNCLMM